MRRALRGQLLKLWSYAAFELVVSEQILVELQRTFEDRYFSSRLSAAQRADNIQLLRDEATVVEITRKVTGVATHPEDDLILATAVSANADYLVTGDGPLQLVRAYRRVQIVSPRWFLDELL